MNQTTGAAGAFRYVTGARALHWMMATWFAFMMISGIIADEYRGEWKPDIMALHKSFGTVLLAAAAARLCLRLKRGAPPYAVPLARGVHAVSGLVHVILYVLMFAVPLSGLWMVTAFGRPPEVFGLFTLPAFIPQDRALALVIKQWHGPLAFGLAGLALAHAAAAFRHAFILKDGVMRRMW